ncbi:MAG: phosphatidylglycerophosphatase A [Tahibacter sp.]
MKLTREQVRAILAHPSGWLATGFGSGLSPYAPGTVGSLTALIPFLYLRTLSVPAYLAVIAVTFAIGVYASARTIDRLKLSDPGFIVIDEFVGQWLALLLAPPQWYWVAVGFVLFRLFDIIKPWPVSWADRRIHGGLGVMLDDAIAGLMAALVMHVLSRYC